MLANLAQLNGIVGGCGCRRGAVVGEHHHHRAKVGASTTRRRLAAAAAARRHHHIGRESSRHDALEGRVRVRVAEGHVGHFVRVAVGRRLVALLLFVVIFPDVRRRRWLHVVVADGNKLVVLDIFVFDVEVDPTASATFHAATLGSKE